MLEADLLEDLLSPKQTAKNGSEGQECRLVRHLDLCYPCVCTLVDCGFLSSRSK